MPKVNERDIFEIKEWLNDTPQNVEEYENMVGGTAPSGTIEISANGEYDVSEYATADVQVEGGSSDFSTATVTVTVSSPAEEVNLIGAFYEEANPPFVPDARTTAFSSFYAEEPRVVKVALYKGEAQVIFSGATSAVATGDIAIYEDNIIITGDGTITFS